MAACGSGGGVHGASMRSIPWLKSELAKLATASHVPSAILPPGAALPQVLLPQHERLSAASPRQRREGVAAARAWG